LIASTKSLRFAFNSGSTLPASVPATASSIWAPASDKNDPKQYAQKLAQQLGVTPDTPIGTLKGRVDDFAHAIAQNEDATMASKLKGMTGMGQQETLAQKIKSKYPQYNDIPDAQLEQKILAKYPQYADLTSNNSSSASQNPPKPMTKGGFVDPSKTTESENNFVTPPAQTTTPSDTSTTAQPAQQSDSLGQKIVKGAGGIFNAIASPIEGVAATPFQAIENPLQKGLIGAAKATGLVGQPNSPLHVPEPVIAPVPLPVRQPVSVAAPVPPFVTGSVPVRKFTPTELVATSLPVSSVPKSAFVVPEKYCEPVVVAF